MLADTWTRSDVLERLRDVERVEQEPDRRRGGGPSRPPARARPCGGSASAGRTTANACAHALAEVGRRGRGSRCRRRPTAIRSAASARSADERPCSRSHEKSKLGQRREDVERRERVLRRAPRRRASERERRCRRSRGRACSRRRSCTCCPGSRGARGRSRTASPAARRDDRVDADAGEVRAEDRAASGTARSGYAAASTFRQARLVQASFSELAASTARSERERVDRRRAGRGTRRSRRGRGSRTHRAQPECRSASRLAP